MQSRLASGSLPVFASALVLVSSACCIGPLAVVLSLVGLTSGTMLAGGMSGVLYGIFGYLFIKSRWEPELGMRIPQSTVVILLAWMLLGFSGVLGDMIGVNMANWAHGIGFLTGVVIAAVPLVLRAK